MARGCASVAQGWVRVASVSARVGVSGGMVSWDEIYTVYGGVNTNGDEALHVLYICDSHMAITYHISMSASHVDHISQSHISVIHVYHTCQSRTYIYVYIGSVYMSVTHVNHIYIYIYMYLSHTCQPHTCLYIPLTHIVGAPGWTPCAGTLGLTACYVASSCRV